MNKVVVFLYLDKGEDIAYQRLIENPYMLFDREKVEKAKVNKVIRRLKKKVVEVYAQIKLKPSTKSIGETIKIIGWNDVTNFLID